MGGETDSVSEVTHPIQHPFPIPPSKKKKKREREGERMTLDKLYYRPNSTLFHLEQFTLAKE